jgi:hypothetical protein
VDLVNLVHSIAEAVERSGNAKGVFGEPLKLETQTVVPVAVVTVTFGGGGVGRLLGGGRGGVALKLLPVGFIHEMDGSACFSRIEIPPEVLSGDDKAASPAGGEPAHPHRGLWDRVAANLSRGE